MEWMILPLKRYAQFSGRSPRREYWMFFLFNIIVQIVLTFLDNVLGLGGHSSSYDSAGANGYAAGGAASGGILSGLWSLAILIPSIAVAVRRLHDLDRSGWWLVAPMILIPIAMVAALGRLGDNAAASMAGFGIFFLVMGLAAVVMGIVLLVWFCMHGTRGPNRFGPDPYAAMDDLHETFR
ncbi:DUF805 domain-containing protein [Sphingomonas sp. CGMCC 1.13654]|uniref:DUF805 domain-containing protein n=1 Tax=Sphingomonas chungangi TaxID=2683589 RepID=A0A838LAZ4_9SPHN|nr:DUF805 domain-containing protein [Sphingomonas chungangi]MBA2936421.1 DUF805 domain-containing protein [Sphingomonas chungangi]MVW55806.1 DUF805 domain-containing protein [Sphingomonas chungangi]